MHRARTAALLAPLAFAGLAATLWLLEALPAREAWCCALAAVCAFVPSGLFAPGGLRRRAAEATLLPAAALLVLVAPVAERRMAVALLLAVAALAAYAAARTAPQQVAPWLAVALALSLKSLTALAAAEGGVGNAGLAWVVAAVVAAAGRRLLAHAPGGLLAALVGLAPLAALPLALALATLVAGTAALLVPHRPNGGAWLAGGAAVLLPAILLGAMLAPWGLEGVSRVIPAATVLAGLLLVTAARWLPAGLVGTATVALTLALVPLPPATSMATVTLDGTTPTALLPAGSGEAYVLTVALTNAAPLAQGTPAAELVAGGERVALRAGVETAEWAHERPDVRAVVAHALPQQPFWRPSEGEPFGVWGVAGRVSVPVAAGVVPSVRRSALLPPDAQVVVAAAAQGPGVGAAGLALRWWWVAVAVTVAVLQVAGRTMSGRWAWLPWAVIETALLGAAIPVEPVARLAQASAPDLALAALLATWLPLARRWLAAGHRWRTALALLLPLSLATPVLTLPLGDDTYQLLLMESLVRDGDLAVGNNIDTARNPNEAVYAPVANRLVHSPTLAVVLAPAYTLAGRSGAGAVLAVAGAALLALAMRRAGELGVPASRLSLASVLLLLSYPLATFATQLWTEMPGALLALAAAVPLVAAPAHAWLATACALLATALKTRLALVALPAAAVAIWREAASRQRVARLLLVTAVTAAAWLVAQALVGTPLDPLGRRRLADLLPTSLDQPPRVVGGLLFDAAGGLAFAAPLLLAAVAALPTLWRRGSAGDRALVLGGVLTVLALLHNLEWRGGDSPPARYLVPLWGTLAVAAALLISRPRPWRRLVHLLVPPSAMVWWVGVTRPAWLVNLGDGGFWLGNCLARRFHVDALDLFPSFLRDSPSRWLVPALLLAVVAAAVAACSSRPRLAYHLGRSTVALWLVVATLTVVFANLKPDGTVEVEDPQVVRRGGVDEPPPGAFSRFRYPNGVRLVDGEEVVVPLRLRAGSSLLLAGWLEGSAEGGARVKARWCDHEPVVVAVAGRGPGVVPLPLGEVHGRGTLVLRVDAPQGGSVVLDRLLVRRR